MTTIGGTLSTLYQNSPYTCISSYNLLYTTSFKLSNLKHGDKDEGIENGMEGIVIINDDIVAENIVVYS